MIGDIESGRTDSWDEVHAAYRRLASLYEKDRLCNAVAVLRYLALESASTVEKLFPDWNGRCLRLNEWIMRQAVETKQKDYENTFRWITYDSAEERSAVLGERITGVSFTLPQYRPVPWI